MVGITKEEMFYLTSKGVNFGENGISRTHTHHPHYYMCENKRNKKLLNEYRRKMKINK